MVKVLHVINGLGLGGAENMLVRLLEGVDRGAVDSVVVTLTDQLDLGPRLEAAGIRVVPVFVRRSWEAPLLLVRLRRVIAQERPDVVETWLYKADLLGGLAARTVRPAPPVVWSLRQTSLDPARSTRSNRVVADVCARLSGLIPARILAVSEEARAAHVATGYRGDRMDVIPNGFDLDRFAPDATAGGAVRTLAGVGDGPVVGLVARFDPQKDHRTFLLAFKELLEVQPRAVAVLCGSGCTDANEDLVGEVSELGLTEVVRLLGPRSDIQRITAGFDVAVSSSAFGEGFSNSIGEALACGVPVVATDSGNARSILADIGWVVPPRDPTALAAAIVDALSDPRDDRMRRVRAGRERMQSYSLPAIVRRYERTWDEVAACAAS